jgi:hypothetical protein
MTDSSTTHGSDPEADGISSDRSQRLDPDATAAESPASKPAASPLGLALFLLYAIFYAGFVLTSAMWPELMQWRPAGGLNLALLWGFSLIGLAIVLAGLYGFQRRERVGLGDRS